MILENLAASYITNGDGYETSAVQINAPSNDIAYTSQSAVVQGKLHLFGGYADPKNVVLIRLRIFFIYFQIARLDACTFVELTYKLNFDCFNGHEALPISDNSEGKIKFLDFSLKFSTHLL